MGEFDYDSRVTRVTLVGRVLHEQASLVHLFVDCLFDITSDDPSDSGCIFEITLCGHV